MKFMRSFLIEPGELKYGVRRTPRSIAYRLRFYFLMVAIRSAILASFCFFLSNAAFDAKGFIIFKGLATPDVWGIALLLITSLLICAATFASRGRMARVGLVMSGAIMITAGSAFMASAIQYDSGWWGAVAYISIGLVDFLVATYPGEVT